MFCYSACLRHLSFLRESGAGGPVRVVGEIGPGTSIGMGLTALLLGAEKYYAFDKVAFVDTAASLDLFDGIVRLLRARAAIEDAGGAHIPIPSAGFTEASFLADGPEVCLAEERLADIRASVVEADSRYVEYVAPWPEPGWHPSRPIDLILSHDVMEHVDDVEATYEVMAAMLAPGGRISSQIDFRSHNLFSTWDGHWFAPKWQWSLIRGQKPILLNRLPLSEHKRQLEKNGLNVIGCATDTAPRTERDISAPHPGSVRFCPGDYLVKRAQLVAMKRRAESHGADAGRQETEAE